MGRRPKTQTLGAWMNGEYVGRWTIDARGEHEFVYDPDWVSSEHGRSISLSLPILAGERLKGVAVKNYFDNLLPDNEQIRSRIQQRFGARSVSPFDLLAEIGRDCVGAMQLMPEGEQPGNVRQIEGQPVTESEIEAILTNTVVFGQRQDDDGFRISLAGAQEKTAFLYDGGQWLKPRGTTPTTHIFKLPIGRHKDRGIDLATSIENEWLCARILDAYGINVTRCSPATFGKQAVLVVERFDRRRSSDGKWIVRLPQEDMCQAMGVSPDQKYEADGGPGIEKIMDLLLGSSNAQIDRLDFFRTQVIFWMLCAIDGHAKNFSLFLEPRSQYRLTPRYDVLSAYPYLGDSPSHLQSRKIKMAMALIGKNRHYKWAELQRRHIEATANICGIANAGTEIINELIAKTEAAIETVTRGLSSDFPGHVSDPIFAGLRAAAARL